MRDKEGMTPAALVEREKKSEGQEWKDMALGEIFQETNLRVRDIHLPQEKIPILSITRDRGLVLQIEKFKHRVASKDISNYKLVHKGELVYGFPINEGVIAILLCSDIGAVSPAYHVWKAKIVLDQDFFNSLVRLPDTIEAFSMLASTTVQRRQNLPPEGFKNVVVSVPPLPEQQAISSVLRTVQQAKEACERVIAATRQLKQSLLQYLFTYGPVPFDQADQVPLKETEIGLMPEPWRFEPLGDHLELIRNGLTRTQNKDGAGFPITRIETISGDTINPKKVGFVEGLSEEEVAKFRLRRNDILFSHINSEPQLGRTAIYLGKPDVLIHGMNLLLLRSGKSMHPIFLDFVCQYLRKLGVFIGIASRAVGQSSINQGKLKALQIPIPSCEEQVEVAAQLSAVEAKLAGEEARRDALDNLFKALLHHLMTGKVRVTA